MYASNKELHRVLGASIAGVTKLNLLHQFHNVLEKILAKVFHQKYFLHDYEMYMINYEMYMINLS